MCEQQLKAVSRALLTSQAFKLISTPCQKLQIDAAQIRNRLKLITAIKTRTTEDTLRINKNPFSVNI